MFWFRFSKSSNLIIWSNEFHAGINFEFLDSNLDEMCELKYPSEASLVSPEAPKSQYFFILIFMPKCRDFFPFKIVTLYAFWAFWLWNFVTILVCNEALESAQKVCLNYVPPLLHMTPPSALLTLFVKPSWVALCYRNDADGWGP